MKLSEVLIKARAKIDKPQKWCAYWWCSENERRLGADGAIWAIAGHGTRLAESALHYLAESSGINRQWDDNDRVNNVCLHREVMIMFDKAIEKALAEKL